MFGHFSTVCKGLSISETLQIKNSVTCGFPKKLRKFFNTLLMRKPWRRIYDPVKDLRWNFFAKIVKDLKPLTIFPNKDLVWENNYG